MTIATASIISIKTTIAVNCELILLDDKLNIEIHLQYISRSIYNIYRDPFTIYRDPFTISQTLPFTISQTLPFTISQTLPFTISQTLPFTISQTLPFTISLHLQYLSIYNISNSRFTISQTPNLQYLKLSLNHNYYDYYCYHPKMNLPFIFIY
jgi:hypothetical protein